MNKIERSKVIKEILDELYPSVPIPLNHTDPFTLLVAVLLSAQCTDERVNLVTPALFLLQFQDEHDLISLGQKNYKNQQAYFHLQL